jgi:hypothetical protein
MISVQVSYSLQVHQIAEEAYDSQAKMLPEYRKKGIGCQSQAAARTQRATREIGSKRTASIRPRSVILSSGITGKARNERVINGSFK